MKWSQAYCACILANTFFTRTKNTVRVDVEGNEMVVRRPGTPLLLAYSKSAEQPRTRTGIAH
jgi:hypothetical protein